MTYGSSKPATQAVADTVDPSLFRIPAPGRREDVVEWDGMTVVYEILDGRVVSMHVEGSPCDELEGRR